jgi:hypothetical protein
LPPLTAPVMLWRIGPNVAAFPVNVNAPAVEAKLSPSIVNPVISFPDVVLLPSKISVSPDDGAPGAQFAASVQLVLDVPDQVSVVPSATEEENIPASGATARTSQPHRRARPRAPQCPRLRLPTTPTELLRRAIFILR